MVDDPGRVFVSYAGPDRAWAEWVAWHLEQDGHPVELDVWDWRTGDDFVVLMSEALKSSSMVVALFSNDYFNPERWTRSEWTATLATKERLVPLVIKPLASADIPEILAPKLRRELHGLDEGAAVSALLNAVNGPARPTVAPGFPGTSAPVAGSTVMNAAPRMPGSVGTPRVWNVVRRNPDFTGRETLLTQLRDGLTAEGELVPYVLHGLGGIGKTQIALEYAHRFASQYDVVWWVDAELAGQLPVHLTALAERLGIVKPEAGAEHNGRALLDHLGTQDRWLLVLDNAEDPSEIACWLPAGNGHVLITSRTPAWSGIARGLDIDIFTRPESLLFLNERIPRITSDQADGLADDLGDLPLALDQAAGVLTASAMPVDHYRRLLAEKANQLMQEGTPRNYPSSLAASVTIAASRLKTDHPNAEPILRLTAFLGPDPIPTAWIDATRAQLATLPAESATDAMWLWNTLPHLARYGLARLSTETLQMHRLTQAVLRDETNLQDAGAVRADVVTLLVAANPGEAESPATWPQWALVSSHLACIAAADDSRFRHLACETALYLLKSGQPTRARELMTALRRISVADSGEDHPDTLTCAQYLGYALSDLGENQAAKSLIEDTLARRRRTLGSDHPDTLHSANDFGVVLNKLGKPSEALASDEETLARRRRVLGVDHPDTLNSAQNLAVTLHTLGKYDEGWRIEEDTLARRQSVLGVDHPDTLRSAQNLAVTLHSFGRYDEGWRIADDTLARYRRVLGDDHPDTLHSASGVALALHALRKYDEARRMAEDTLARCRRVLGDDHPDTLGAALGFGSNLHAVGEYDEARRIKEDTLARCRRVLGDDHPDTLNSASGLANTLNALGKYDEARRVAEDALARYRRVLGDDHPYTLNTALIFAAILYDLREYDEACQTEEDTLARCRCVLGDDHPDTLNTALNLAQTLAALRRHDEAEALLRDTLARCRRVLGNDHPTTRQVIGILAEALEARGRSYDAQQLKKPMTRSRLLPTRKRKKR